MSGIKEKANKYILRTVLLPADTIQQIADLAEENKTSINRFTTELVVNAAREEAWRRQFVKALCTADFSAVLKV